MSPFSASLLISLSRLILIFIVLWDIWVWRFTWYSEAYGVPVESFSWDLVGILLLSAATTLLGVCWGLTRFARSWGVLFWITWLLLFSYSRALDSSAHHFLLILFPFLILFPIHHEPYSVEEESPFGVTRAFLILIGVASISCGLTMICTVPFDSQIFETDLSRIHGVNQLLFTQTFIPWGWIFAILHIIIGLLLLYGNDTARLLSSVFFFLTGILTYGLFRLELFSLLLILLSFLLMSTLRSASQETEESPVFWLNTLFIRQSFAWVFLILFLTHGAGKLFHISLFQRIPETVGYHTNWNPLGAVHRYSEVELEARRHGVWTTLIGKSGQREWKTAELMLLVTPATQPVLPTELSPRLTRQMELMLKRWQIEWGERYEQYRLVSMDTQYGESILRSLNRIPEDFEGNRNKE